MSPGADSEGGACVLLAANINLRGRVLADAHEGQAGLDAACLQGRYPQARLIQKLLRDGPSVYEVRGCHGRTKVETGTVSSRIVTEPRRRLRFLILIFLLILFLIPFVSRRGRIRLRERLRLR